MAAHLPQAEIALNAFLAAHVLGNIVRPARGAQSAPTNHDDGGPDGNVLNGQIITLLIGLVYLACILCTFGWRSCARFTGRTLLWLAGDKQAGQANNGPPPDGIQDKKVSGVMSQCTYGMYRGEIRFRSGNQGFTRSGESDTCKWSEWMNH